jgi:hypothetical protein
MIKSIMRNGGVGAAALALTAAGLITVTGEFEPAAAQPGSTCSTPSQCAGGAGTGGTDSNGKAQGSRVATTLPGTTTTTVVPFGGPALGSGWTLVGTSTMPTAAVEFDIYASTGAPTTVQQEGSPIGGRSVSQSGTSSTSTVTGHH